MTPKKEGRILHSGVGNATVVSIVRPTGTEMQSVTSKEQHGGMYSLEISAILAVSAGTNQRVYNRAASASICLGYSWSNVVTSGWYRRYSEF